MLSRISSARHVPHRAGIHLAKLSAIPPAMVHSLPAPLRDGFVHAYASALPPIFLYLGPLFAAAFVLSLFLKEIPPARGADDRGSERAGVPGGVDGRVDGTPSELGSSSAGVHDALPRIFQRRG